MPGVLVILTRRVRLWLALGLRFFSAERSELELVAGILVVDMFWVSLDLNYGHFLAELNGAFAATVLPLLAKEALLADEDMLS